MNEQVLSIEQMQELIAMNVDTSKASMIWEYKGSDENKNFYNLDILDYDNDFIAKEDIPTFTLQDILSMLPVGYHIETDRHKKGHIVYSIHQDWDNGQICWGDNLLEIAFNMLKWMKQNNYI